MTILGPLEWLVTILGWWLAILRMVDDQPESGILPSWVLWVPLLEMVGDLPWDGR